jgi:hypothetical protein
MKKNPFKKYTEQSGLHPYIAVMASDSRLREITYLKYGCNTFEGKIQSRPMGFWLEEDVWAYIKKFNIPYCSIYDKGQKRTGCMFCMFGTHLEKCPNKFQCMAKTHPQLYDYCMNKLELKKVLEYLELPYKPIEDDLVTGTPVTSLKKKRGRPKKNPEDLNFGKSENDSKILKKGGLNHD